MVTRYETKDSEWCCHFTLTDHRYELRCVAFHDPEQIYCEVNDPDTTQLQAINQWVTLDEAQRGLLTNCPPTPIDAWKHKDRLFSIHILHDDQYAITQGGTIVHVSTNPITRELAFPIVKAFAKGGR